VIVWAVRVLLVLALLLGVALGVQTWRLDRADKRDVEARAKIQGAALEAAGLKRAAEVSQAELARIVPELKAELAAANRTGATVASASHWTGTGAAVPVPCIDTMGPPAGTSTPAPHPAPPGEPGAPLIPVTPHVKIDDAIAIDDAGGLYVARHVQAKLSVGESWESAWEAIEADAASKTAVNPDVAAAWKAWKNPPPKIAFIRSPKLWRFGLACGIGGGYGVVAQGPDVVAACIYGAQF